MAEKKPRKRLTAAAQAARDSLMVARRVQGWTWEATAREAGITVRQAKNAVKARQEGAPLQFAADPVRVVEEIFTAYQLSIGDFEAIALQAIEDGNLAAAVGAKRSANDARDKVLTLLQLTGRLPQELGSLRHLMDLRAIAVRMLDTMDAFEREMGDALKLRKEADRVEAGREAARKVRLTFNELLGIESPPEELPAIEAESVEA